MTTNEDLYRLRLAAEDAAGGPPSAEQVDALIAYADALEAELAARQPSEDDREVLAKRLRDIGAVRKVDQDCSCQDCEGAAEWVNAPLSVVLDHFKTNVSDAEPALLVCAWCPQPARGDAWHNDGKLHPSCGQIDHGQGWVPPYTPRAAVPDAANRELTEAIRLTVEYVGNDMLPAIEGWDWYDALVKYAPEVAQAFADKPIHFPKSAERDAALAAVERCRGVLSAWESRQERNREILGNGAIGHFKAIDCTGDLRAALDGAPEPEWEYARENRYGSVCEPDDSREQAEYRAALSGGYNTVVRRRPAGPSLPVEGEKP